MLREAAAATGAAPALAQGLRAALVTIGPLLLIPVLARPELSWASLAGFGATLCDKGGAYRTRAAAVALYLAFGVAAVSLGSLAAPHLAPSAALLFAGVGLCAFARVFGAEGTSVGLGVATALVVALANPASPTEAGARAGFFALGTAWAAAFTLVLWPARVFRPAREAVGAALAKVAALAAAVSTADDLGTDAWRDRRRELVGPARESIEAARAVLASLRRGRPGRSRRAEQILVVLETTDRVFGLLVALDDVTDEREDASNGPLRAAAASLSEALAAVAEGLDRERAPAHVAMPAEGEAELGPRAAALVRGAREAVGDLVSAAAAVEGDDAPEAVAPSEMDAPPSPMDAARENLSMESVVARYALRVAVCTTAVDVAARALHLQHGYWATITCLITLQPQGTATLARAVQRVAGTVVGAGLAVALGRWVHGAWGVMALVFATAAACVSLLPMNYGLYAVFLTPTFVVLAERSAGAVSLAPARILDTLFGAAAALAGSALVLPISERDQFAAQMSSAVKSARALLDAVTSPESTDAGVRSARAALGVALVNADASFQRLQTEAPPPAEEREAMLALLLYTRRLASGLVALGYETTREAREARAIARAHPGLGPRLDAMALRIADPGAEAEPEGEVTVGEATGAYARVERLARQVEMQRAAVQRWRG
ncbi:MAG: FUSC family protein [Polyangiales bacterium]